VPPFKASAPSNGFRSVVRSPLLRPLCSLSHPSSTAPSRSLLLSFANSSSLCSARSPSPLITVGGHHSASRFKNVVSSLPPLYCNPAYHLVRYNRVHYFCPEQCPPKTPSLASAKTGSRAVNGSDFEASSHAGIPFTASHLAADISRSMLSKRT
jgi:hypothetical protein